MNAPGFRAICLTAAAATLSLTACGSGAGKQTATSQAGVVYPAGIDTQNPAQDLKGISPASQPQYCCWTQRRNHLKLQFPKDARFVSLVIDVPSDAYRGRSQGITVTFPGAAAQHQPLNVGHQEVRFEIPASVRGRKEIVDLTLDDAFVPAKIGLNHDTTEYGVLLHSIAFSP
jgi:hypothetical protein